MYTSIGVELYKPYLRAQMESDMRQIAEGSKNAEQIKAKAIEEMHKIFTQTTNQKEVFKQKFSEKFQGVKMDENKVIFDYRQDSAFATCPTCHESKLQLR